MKGVLRKVSKFMDSFIDVWQIQQIFSQMGCHNMSTPTQGKKVATFFSHDTQIGREVVGGGAGGAWPHQFFGSIEVTMMS